MFFYAKKIQWTKTFNDYDIDLDIKGICPELEKISGMEALIWKRYQRDTTHNTFLSTINIIDRSNIKHGKLEARYIIRLRLRLLQLSIVQPYLVKKKI